MLLPLTVTLSPPAVRHNPLILSASNDAAKNNPPIEYCWFAFIPIAAIIILHHSREDPTRFKAYVAIARNSLAAPPPPLTRMCPLHAPPSHILLLFNCFIIFNVTCSRLYSLSCVFLREVRCYAPNEFWLRPPMYII